MSSTFVRILTVVSVISTAVAQTAYANDFIDPDYILGNEFGGHTGRAQLSIVGWAQTLAIDGPWSVMDKTITAPSGDKHDYLSWAPYWWPDCRGVGNNTVLTDEQVWTTCPYKNRDGEFNPDGRLVNNVGDFQSMSEAVLYGALAWTFDTTTAAQRTQFEANVVRFIRAWFLDADTAMNPNFDYGQMQRGPDGQVGSHIGILDLKGMAKITSAILLLRKGGSSAWTTDLDNQMIAWSRKYITWLETAEIAIEEAAATNNHGSFYFNQLAALKVLVNDLPGAKAVTDTFFDGIYLEQITANGEQPLEAARTRPYHYRSYNLAAMITNARIAKYVDPKSNIWQKPTNEGATIKSALDFALPISAGTSGETKYASELYPNVAAVAAAYGDSDGKYLKFLKTQYPSFMAEPFILWNQPFAEGEASGVLPVVTSTPQRSSSSKASSTAVVGHKDKISGALSTTFSGFSGLACISATATGFLAVLL